MAPCLPNKKQRSSRRRDNIERVPGERRGPSLGGRSGGSMDPGFRRESGLGMVSSLAGRRSRWGLTRNERLHLSSVIRGLDPRISEMAGSKPGHDVFHGEWGTRKKQRSWRRRDNIERFPGESRGPSLGGRSGGSMGGFRRESRLGMVSSLAGRRSRW